MSASEGRPDPIVTLDFARFFPHKFWVSDWSADGSYPDGFRYKVFSVRDQDTDTIELVIVMEEPGELKTERLRWHVGADAFDAIAEDLLTGLEKRFEIEFQEQDLTDVRTPWDLAQAQAKFGWRDWES